MKNKILELWGSKEAASRGQSDNKLLKKLNDVERPRPF